MLALEYRIGNLRMEDVESNKKEMATAHDPWANAPKRHKGLIVNQQKPFNAKTRLSILGDSFLTPQDQQEIMEKPIYGLVDPHTKKWCCPAHLGYEKRGSLWKHWNWCESAKDWRKGVVEPKLMEMGVLEDGRLITVMKFNKRLGRNEEIVVAGEVWVCGVELNRLWCSVERGKRKDNAYLSQGIVHKVGQAIAESHQDPPQGIKEGRLVHVWNPDITSIYVQGLNDRKKKTVKKMIDERKWEGLEIRLQSFIFLVKSHFVVVHVDRDNKSIEFFDSLPGHLSSKKIEELIEKVKGFLQLLDPESVFTQVDANHKRATDKCPEQPNTVDCGVMAILSIEAFVLDDSFPADKTAWQQRAREARVKLCYNIVEHNNFSLTSIPPPSAYNLLYKVGQAIAKSHQDPPQGIPPCTPASTSRIQVTG